MVWGTFTHTKKPKQNQLKVRGQQNKSRFSLPAAAPEHPAPGGRRLRAAHSCGAGRFRVWWRKAANATTPIAVTAPFAVRKETFSALRSQPFPPPPPSVYLKLESLSDKFPQGITFLTHRKEGRRNNNNNNNNNRDFLIKFENTF